MAQDRESGARAAKWGREAAGRLAKAIGATGFAGRSNECVLGGKRVIIKCAAVKTGIVGITYKTLERIEEIIGAFELDDGSFELWALTPEAYAAEMRDSAGKKTAGQTGQVRKAHFEKHGRPLSRVTP